MPFVVGPVSGLGAFGEVAPGFISFWLIEGTPDAAQPGLLPGWDAWPLLIPLMPAAPVFPGVLVGAGVPFSVGEGPSTLGVTVEPVELVVPAVPPPFPAPDAPPAAPPAPPPPPALAAKVTVLLTTIAAVMAPINPCIMSRFFITCSSMRAPLLLMKLRFGEVVPNSVAQRAIGERAENLETYVESKARGQGGLTRAF
jgi:hypothetical protein